MSKPTQHPTTVVFEFGPYAKVTYTIQDRQPGDRGQRYRAVAIYMSKSQAWTTTGQINVTQSRRLLKDLIK